MKIRAALLLALVIIGIYALNKGFFFKNRGLNANLIQVDTTAVTAIIITPGNAADEISLYKEGTAWIASTQRLSIKPPANTVQQLLKSLVTLKTNQVLTNLNAVAEDLGLDETQATRVRVYGGTHLLEDFWVGNRVPSDTTAFYLRFSGAKEVYIVHSKLHDLVGLSFASYRNRQIINIPLAADLQSFSYEISDSTYLFSKKADKWTLADKLVDSIALQKLITSWSEVSGTWFADDFDEVQDARFLYKTLIIKLKSKNDPIRISCYRDTTRTPPYVIHSSENKDSYFASDSLGIYKILFREIADFQQKPPAPQQ